MYVLTTLVFLILLFITLMAVVPLKTAFTLNSEELPKFHMMFSWLNPLFKGTISKLDEKTVLKAYLFNKKILTKNLKGEITDINSKFKLLRELHPHFTKFEASYSFNDPSYTGLVCGVINMLPQYLDLDNLDNHPDFGSYSEFFNINAIAEMNLLSLTFSFLRLNRKSAKVQTAH